MSDNGTPKPADKPASGVQELDWCEVRVVAKKRNGRLKYRKHGIGRGLQEALQTVDVPDGYDIIEAEVTRKGIDPTEFEMYYTHPMFKELT